MRPTLLVRSGQGIPKWISPLECQKLAVGTSIFECCEMNHTTIDTCQKPMLSRAYVSIKDNLFTTLTYVASH